MAGTGTEVGKTWVSAELLGRLRSEGLTVGARKPVQSYEPTDATTDARELAASTAESQATVCPDHRHYEIPMAPPMAADVLGRPRIELTDLVNEINQSWPSTDLEGHVVGLEFGLIETVGGVRSPISHDGDSAELIGVCHPDMVVLVADAGLGTINAVETSIDSLNVELIQAPIVVFLNRFHPDNTLHEMNRDYLAQRHVVITGIADLAIAVLG